MQHTAILSGAALLAACAPPTTADQTTSADSGDDAAEPTPTPNISSIGTGETEVIFWHGLGGADGKTMTELLEVYAEENPDVTVQQELLTWDIFYQKVPTSVIAGNPPDMIITHEWAIGQFGARDMLRAADEFYEVRGLPQEDFLEFAFNNITHEGTPLGVLLDNHGQGGYLNVELFEEAGLDPESPPQTPTEFLEIASQLTRDSNGRAPTDSGFDPESIEQWAFTWTFWQRWAMLSTIWQNGGDTITEDGTTSLIDQEAVRDALQWWHDAVHTHHIMALPFGWDRADAYVNNRLAMYVNGSWDLNFIRDSGLEDKTRAFFAPQVTGTQPAVWMSAHVMAIPNGVDEERTGPAGDLITWLSEHGLEWANSGQPPARLSQQNSEQLQSHWHTGVFSRQFQEIGRTERQHVNITEIQEAYQPEFEAALTDQKTIDEALATAHERVQKVLDRV
ncbi:ABC transporter substrate-binding protein [Chloroflexi bacterium TSY]|nr:ABC transporter substrate-binding protein [Chloroflexi bacterium TSY]